MGPYCNYCGRRCFVPRRLPDDSREVHMATCPEGMSRDREVTGYDHRSAVNPVTQGERPAPDAESLAKSRQVDPGIYAAPEVRRAISEHLRQIEGEE